MSLSLDPRTLFVTIAAVFAALVIASASVWRQAPGVPGCGRFTLGLGLVGAGSLLRALQGHAPEAVVILASNGLLGLGCVLAFEGTRRFYGRATLRALTLPLVAGQVLVVAYYFYVTPSVNARIVVVNGVLALLLGAGAWTVYVGGRREGGGPAVFTTLACLGLLSATLGVRAVLTAAGARAESDLLAGDALTAWSMLLTPFCSIVWTLGFVGLVNGRLTAAARVAREQLAESEARYRSLVEASPDLIYRTDELGYFTYVNPAASRVLGYSEAELLNRRFLDIIRADHRAAAADFYAKQALQAIPSTYFEFPVATPRGGAVWIGQNVQLLVREGEVGFEAVARDVTARRRAEDELRAQKDLHASLVAVARATTREPELRATLRATLEVVEALTGAAASSLILLHDDGSVRQAVVSRQGVRTAEPIHARRLLQDGLAGWVARERQTALVGDVTADPRWRRLPGGAPIGSALSVPVTAGADLTAVLTLFHPRMHHFRPEHVALIEEAAVQIGLALRNAGLFEDVSAQRARLAAVIENSRDGLVLVVDGRLALANAPAVALLGLREPAAAWLGRPLADLLEVLGPVLPEEALAQWERPAGPAAGGEARFRDRAMVWMSVGVPSVGRLLVLRDVSAERQAMELRESLTHMLVHDLRQPLAAILGALELVAHGGLDPQQREMLELAERNTLRQLEMIDTVLEVGRLEQQALPVEPQAVSLSELAGEVLGRAAPRAAVKGVALSALIPADLPPAWADVALVGRVLENLVGNAIKFTPRGGSATVTAAAVEDGALRVDVSDTGPGIPLELTQRLFQKFSRGNVTGQGSGLGLAFCRLAVEAHGGKLWLDRAASPGATFSFTLPTASAHA